jgi:hypothetical protein
MLAAGGREAELNHVGAGCRRRAHTTDGAFSVACPEPVEVVAGRLQPLHLDMERVSDSHPRGRPSQT